jgi:endonuclease YncB( thermonuclease family)
MTIFHKTLKIQISTILVLCFSVLLISFILPKSASSSEFQGQELVGKVVGISDGDTITVLDAANKQHTVRLYPIDAPETSCHSPVGTSYDNNCVEHTQPFGKTSKKSLSDLIYSKQVHVKLREGDSYGREIGTVYVDDMDSSLEQIKAGMAWFYRQYAQDMPAVKYAVYDAAENYAKSNKLGLWGDENPVSPWDYRRDHPRH